MKRRLLILLIVWALTIVAPLTASALTVQGPQTFIVELTPTTVTYASGATLYGSGTTTAYNTSTRAGVSTLFIRGDNKIFIDESMAGTTFIYNPSRGVTMTALDSQNAIRNIADLGPYGTLQIIGVTPAPATLVGGAYSGVTLELGYYSTTLKTAEEGRENAWLAAERIPIWKGAYSSGDSLWAQSFQFPAGAADARFYVRAGTAGIGALRAKLTLGLPRDQWTPPTAIHLGTLVWGPLGLNGTSAFSSGDSYSVQVPDGARYMLLKSADSGNSLWYSRRAVIDREKDPALQAGDMLPISGSYAEFKRICVGAATSGVKAIVEFFTGKPF